MKVRFGVSAISGTAFPHRRDLDKFAGLMRIIGHAARSPASARREAGALLLSLLLLWCLEPAPD